MNPTVAQEWIAFLALIPLIIVFDRLSVYKFFQGTFGLVYLLAIVWAACWAGLRAAIGGCLLIIAYVYLVFHFPISPNGRDQSKALGSIISTAIVYPIFAVIAGVVQNRMREAAIREFDARQAAESEAQQRRIAEAELWASEETRRLIVDCSIDAIVGLSSDGIITVWNPNAEKLFGWTQEEAIGHHLRERILLPKQRSKAESGLQRLLHFDEEPNLRTHIELLAATKTGGEISIEIYIADQRVETGSLYIMFVRDISDRKRAEKEIRDLNASLEGRVAERTAQLEAANNELTGFTYSVSHDLRAPLRAIVANSRMVYEDTRDKLDSENSERLKRLETSALNMARLIEDLLQFARIGQVALHVRDIDLTAMANEIAKHLQSMKQGSVIVQEGMVTRGDPEMIRMVLFNLMENAWKYTPPEKTPEVEVGSTHDRKFFVRDHGVGFDMRYVDKIWEPFERLHRETEYPGTGIGLANSKRIVTRHGGKMWAESAVGQGTTVYFQLQNSCVESPVAVL